jgi:CRP-like cAMP-binding protein
MVRAMKPPPGANGENVTTYKQGMILMREGARALNACIVLTGKVQVFKTVGDQEVVLAEVGPGGVVGEMALIDDAPRMASVRALEPTSVWVVPKASFTRLLKSSPPLMRYILQNFLRNIRHTSDRVVKARVGAS